MHKDAKIIAIYGRRGSGKSTMTQHQMRDRSRVVVFDPQGEYACLRGFTRVETFHDLVGALKAGWQSGFKIAFVPGTEFKQMLHGVSHVLWEAQAPYQDGADDRKVTLVVEEMSLSYPPKDLPAGQDGFTRAVLQGRHRGIEIIGVTQRPASVHPHFRSNAHETFCFPLSDLGDITTVSRQLGGADLRDLPEFTALHYDGVTGRRVSAPKPAR